MTDTEIIKALEEELKTALVINHRFEESNDTENPDDHKFIALLSNTIKLINRQKAEIERLEYCIGVNVSSIGTLHKRLLTAKAEAIKEFAEKVKKIVHEKSFDAIAMLRIWGEIDNLVKKLTGEHHDSN